MIYEKQVYGFDIFFKALNKGPWRAAYIKEALHRVESTLAKPDYRDANWVYNKDGFTRCLSGTSCWQYIDTSEAQEFIKLINMCLTLEVASKVLGIKADMLSWQRRHHYGFNCNRKTEKAVYEELNYAKAIGLI